MTLEQLPLIMAKALILTIIIECAVAWILGVRTKRGQITVVLANVLTNPLVVSIGAAVMYFIGFKAVFPATMVMEIIVVIIEGMVYRRDPWISTSPFLLSLICNAVSYVSGEFIM